MIGKLFRWLFNLCEHKWKIIEIYKVTYGIYDSVYYKYSLQCEKCGNIKTKNV